jgi:hypothetical protein
MNRLQNAQKQLAESLAALESAVEQAQNSAAHADGSFAPAHSAPAIDIDQLSQDLTAIEADLETAMKMIADLTTAGLSSGNNKDSL